MFAIGCQARKFTRNTPKAPSSDGKSSDDPIYDTDLATNDDTDASTAGTSGTPSNLKNN